MDDRDLDHLLLLRGKAPLPALPAMFRRDVWREIRRRKAEAGARQGTWFGWLLEPLFRPAMVFTALAMAMVLGVGLGTTSAESRNTQTRVALDLQVFGSSSPALPSTLMGYTK